MEDASKVSPIIRNLTTDPSLISMSPSIMHYAKNYKRCIYFLPSEIQQSPLSASYLMSSGIAWRETNIVRGPTLQKNPVSSDAVVTTKNGRREVKIVNETTDGHTCIHNFVRKWSEENSAIPNNNIHTSSIIINKSRLYISFIYFQYLFTHHTKNAIILYNYVPRQHIHTFQHTYPLSRQRFYLLLTVSCWDPGT